MALTLGPSTNRGLLLPLPSPPDTPTALPECCPDDMTTTTTHDEPPTQSQLRRLESYPLYDSSNTPHPFSSLFSPSCLRKQRLLLIFIRNFFCGNCQQYLLTLSALLPPASLPSDLAIAIVGCGAPSLLPSYLELTHCPYPLYTDPSSRLYAKLGMKRSWSLGSVAPQYIQQSLLLGGLKSIAQGLKRLPAGDVTKAGEMDLNGGEFLFRRTADQGFWTDDWEVEWCHRMRNTRDHTEVGKLRRTLGLERASTDPAVREAKTWAAPTRAVAKGTKEGHGKRWAKRSLSMIPIIPSRRASSAAKKDAIDEAPPADPSSTSTSSSDRPNQSQPQVHPHKRTPTSTSLQALPQALSQKSHTVIRTFTFTSSSSKHPRPGTAGSWTALKNAPSETQKRSLTPAVAMAMPDLFPSPTVHQPDGKGQQQKQQKQQTRTEGGTHRRKHSRSKSAAQVLGLKVLTVRGGGEKLASSSSSSHGAKAAAVQKDDDGASESHVALVSVVRSPGALSFRSLATLGSPEGTPVLVAAGRVGGGGGR